jgi:hypothetical protein
LFVRAPLLIDQTILAFSDANDPYVRERMLGAAYGALLHIHDKPLVLRAAAEAAYKMVFSATAPERHAVVRHCARGIVEIAATRADLPKTFDLKRCRPPYATPPITTWPSRAAIKKLDNDQVGAYGILSSVVGHYVDPERDFSMAGDFGTYTMSAIGRCFSEMTMHEGVPQTPALLKAQFWEEIAKLGRKAGPLGAAACDAREAWKVAEAALHWETARPPDGYAARSPASVEDLKQKFEEAENQLLRALTPALRARFKAKPPYEEHRDTYIKPFHCSSPSAGSPGAR